MKRFLFLIASSILFFASLATSWADSFVMEAGNGKKLYKWDGKHMMTYGNGRKLFTWEGQYVKAYGNGKKLLKTEGVIPIPLVIALVTGQI